MVTILELATLMVGLGSLIAGVTSAVKLYLEHNKKPSANSRKPKQHCKGR